MGKEKFKTSKENAKKEWCQGVYYSQNSYNDTLYTYSIHGYYNCAYNSKGVKAFG